MNNKISKLKKGLYIIGLLVSGISTYGQVRIVNSTANPAALNSSSFIDASSNNTVNASFNIGKGLLFPRTNLTTFTSFGTTSIIGGSTNYPTYYDGMIVYNTADSGVAGVGLTEGNLCRGFWLYDNPTTNVNGGTWRPIKTVCSGPGAVISLDCNNIVKNGTLTAGVPVTTASGVSFVVGYTGGNGGIHNGETVTSTGVMGLTATLDPGSFQNGGGSLTYTITGTPSGPGTALFDVNIGGQQCIGVTFTVDAVAAATCRAFTAPGVLSEFMCYNLGADPSMDPHIPVKEIHGYYYQWGRPAVVADADTPPGSIAGWSATAAPDNAWMDATKKGADPCPDGYRVPTGAQWQGVIDNNVETYLGPFTSGPNSFESAVVYTNGSEKLTLPAAGGRDGYNGVLSNRGNAGFYWSSTQNGIDEANVATFYINNTDIQGWLQRHAFSVRCIKDTPSAPGTITSLNCNSITRTGTLTAGVTANNGSGVFFTITYDGNGGAYNGQTIPSTSVQGLTATLIGNNFANGTGTLTYTITGVPSGTGTAFFNINIGGKACPNISFPVGGAATVCGAYIAPGNYRQFMCYNLGVTDISLDPFTPAAGIHGDKFQWGEKDPILTQAEDQAQFGAISNWDTTAAPAGSWLDVSKTINDPCPDGYRVPTSAQWQGVIDYNTKTFIGTWNNNAFNYTSVIKYGPNLPLPAASNRDAVDGHKANVNRGDYWSTTINSISPGTINGFSFGLTTDGANSYAAYKTYGFPVRCIKE